jgi:hypothetical protein
MTNLEIVAITDKRKIVEKVNTLSSDVHMELFYYLFKTNNKYTINNNGVFFNLNTLNDKVLDELDKMVIFCYKNEKKLNKKYMNRYEKESDNETI